MSVLYLTVDRYVRHSYGFCVINFDYYYAARPLHLFPTHIDRACYQLGSGQSRRL